MQRVILAAAEGPNQLSVFPLAYSPIGAFRAE